MIQYKKILLIFFLMILCGCVERKITIVSDPPGSSVWLDGKKIGTTPVTTPFVFHGTREITLQKKGYEIISSMEKVSMPIYQIFPIDFFAEFCCPYTFQDTHTFYYTMKPQLPQSTEEKQDLLKRAEKFKQTSIPQVEIKNENH